MEAYKFTIHEESSEIIVENVDKLRKFEEELMKIFCDGEYIETLRPSFEYVDLSLT